MDDGSNEYEQIEPQQQGPSRLDNLAESIYDYRESRNQKDVDAIKNRKKNEPINPNRTSQDKTTAKSKNSDIGEKDDIDSDKDKKEDKEDKKNSKDKKDSKDNKDKKDKKDNKDKKGKNESLSPAKNLKKKWEKLKIKLIIAGIILGCCMFLILLAFIATAVDNIVGSISTFFGIKEAADYDESTETLEDEKTLLESEEYIIDPETGGTRTQEELVEYLKSNNNSCTKVTIWNKIGDFFSGIDDECSMLRFIKTKEENYEKKYPGLQMDRALIISSIFFGYASQPDYPEYNDSENAEIIVTPAEHFASLEDLLNDKNKALKKDDIQELMLNSFIADRYTYYTWQIEPIIEKDKDGNNVEVGKEGNCQPITIDYNTYDANKWQIFMRFGGKVVLDLKGQPKEYIGASGKYQEVLMYSNAYNSTDTFCNGTTPKADLLAIVKAAAGAGEARLNGNVDDAIEAFEKGVPPSTAPLLQKADKDSPIQDVINDANLGAFGTVKLDYKNGFTYQKFPVFKYSIESPDINISYNELLTPKVIEDTIQMILERKPDMNDVIDYPDMGGNLDYLYGADTRYSVLKGAYCGNYLTAPLDSIQVTLNDCDGNFLKTIPFKQYIVGVANGEVSDTEDDYVKAEMAAAITYALKRNNNYSKGSVITMRSGNCDQVYCHPSEGCTSKTAVVDCGGFKCTSYIPNNGSGSHYYPSITAKYEQYYEEVKDFLIVKGDELYSVGYVNTTQNKWEASAKEGKSFTQIMQETYTDGEVIQCSAQISDSDTEDKEEEIKNRTGNKATDEYPKVARDIGDYYGFSYKDDGNSIIVNPEWINANIVELNTSCPSAGWTNVYNVNVQAKEKFQKAFSNICVLLTSGVKLSDGTTCKLDLNQLSGGTTLTNNKLSNGIIPSTAYGIAQVWNSDLTVKVGDRSYNPYGTNDAEKYEAFIDALGGEEKCDNVNYILWKYAYKDAGFKWGGNDSSAFNPKLFEVQ